MKILAMGLSVVELYKVEKQERENDISDVNKYSTFSNFGVFFFSLSCWTNSNKVPLKNRLRCYSLLCSGNQERGTINFDDLVSLPLHVVLSEIRLREINYELHQRQFGIEKNILFLFLTKKRSDETPNTNIVRKKDSPNFQIDTHLLALLFE